MEQTLERKRFFPSYPAAALFGAVFMPLSGLGLAYFTNGVLFLFWAVLTFFVPIIISTIDLRRSWELWRKNKWDFGFSRKLLAEFYLPTWGRMGVYIVSAVVAVVALQLMGVKF
jgi:hypothetical protein